MFYIWKTWEKSEQKKFNSTKPKLFNSSIPNPIVFQTAQIPNSPLCFPWLKLWTTKKFIFPLPDAIDQDSSSSPSDAESD